MLDSLEVISDSKLNAAVRKAPDGLSDKFLTVLQILTTML